MSALAVAYSDTGMVINDRRGGGSEEEGGRGAGRGGGGRGKRGAEQHQSSWTWYKLINAIRSRTEQTVHHMLLLERLEREDKGGEEGEAKGGEEGGEWRGGGEGGCLVAA